MGKPYSMDLRERIFGDIAAGNARRAAARLFCVSASTAVRLAAEHRARRVVTPTRQGCAPGTVVRLKPHMAFLVEIARAEPEITLRELAGALEQTHGVPVLVLVPGTVVILDNPSTHKSPKAAEILKAVGCRMLFLPAYSPDLNPIEMAFSKLKAHLRRVGPRSHDALIQALGDICGLYDPEECWNFFKAAGYASD